jgi:hypothetical protein
MPPAKHVQRQIAVTIVVAVEEATFLVAVQRIVRGIEVENDFLGRRPSRKRSTNSRSIAAPSWPILW